MKPNARLIGVLIVLVAGLLGSAAWAQTETRQITINSIDASHFPEVQVNFRVASTSGQFVDGLTGFTVAENGQPVGDISVRLNDAQPVTIVYVLDLGRYSGTTRVSDTLLRQIVRQWAGTGFRDGIDTASIVVSGGANYPTPTTFVLPPSQSLDDFRAAIDGLNMTPGQAVQSLDTVQQVLTQLADFGVQPSDAVYVVYVSRVVDRATNSDAVTVAQTVGAQATALSVPVYVLHTDPDGSYVDPFQALAAASGGQYLPFHSRVDTTALLTTLYGNLSTSGKAYVATYRSTSGDSAARTVTVGMAENGVQPAGANYQVSITPPAVAILQPEAGFALVRTATEASVGTDHPVFDVDSSTVRFTVTWTDGFPRPLSQVEILANRAVIATFTDVVPVTEPTAPDAVTTPVVPPGEGTEGTVVPVTETYEISLDLTGFITEGITDQSLEVRVTDALALQATSPAVSGSLTVDLPAVLPTVNLVSPANNVTVDRVATLDSAGEITGYSVNEIPLLAQLVWSGAAPGEIVSAEIVVDGSVVSNIPYPTVTLLETDRQMTFVNEPVPAQSSLELSWDVSALTTAGSNLHDVQVQVRNAAGLVAISDPVTVNVQVSVPELQLPTITIISPQMNSTISRIALPRSGDALDFQDSGVQTVIAAVAWQDDIPRTLAVAELLYNGLPLGTESFPMLLSPEEAGAPGSSVSSNRIQYFRLNWNISSIRTSGANLGQLQVRVRDTDGFEAVSSPVTVNVQVSVVSPPTVTILAPVNNSVIARAGQPDRNSATPTFDTRQTAVDAVVEWSSQLPFVLSGADLLVNGAVVGSLAPGAIASAAQSRVDLPNGGNRLALHVPWDISGIQTAGANLYQLQVRVRDEAGITAISQPVNVNVQVNVPQALPPVVTITSPLNSASLTLAENRLSVTAEALWADNQVRSLQLVELSVDGIVRQTLFYPPGTRFELVWDTGGALASGSHQITVRARDVAGLEATSPAITVNLEAAIAAAPTAVGLEDSATAPTGTEQPVSAVESTATAPASTAVCPPTLLDGWNSVNCLRERAVLYLPWVAVAAVTGLLLIRTQKLRPGGISRTIVGVGRKRRPIGRLYVMQGPAAKVGQDINLYANITTLGRDPRLTDIQLYQLDDESSISAQHCTIRHVRGRFTLMDDNSTNGTQVNGLYVNEPVLLNEGDEITLGIPDRMGAVLRFHPNVIDMKDEDAKAQMPSTPKPANAANSVKEEKPVSAVSAPVRNTRNQRAKSIDVMDNILSEIAEKTDKPFRPNLTSSEEEKR